MRKFCGVILPIWVFAMLGASCSDPNALPENVILSPEGLQIELEWTIGTTSAEALQLVDLDIKLMRGTEIVGRSGNVSRFESLRMHKTLHDGEFRLDVESYRVGKRADFILTISDAENLKSRVYTSYFRPGEKTALEYLRIVKKGDHYTISPYKK